MDELDPPVSLEKPENDRHMRYLWTDEVARKDFDFPEVAFVYIFSLIIMLVCTSIVTSPTLVYE